MGNKNFAISTVATAPAPAASGVTLTLAAGTGALFSTAPFYVTIWPTGVNPTAANAEIAYCTDVTGDVLTLTRAQESTAARTVIVGDQVANTITVDTLRRFDYILLLNDADGLYYKWKQTVVDGERVLAPTDDAGVP